MADISLTREHEQEGYWVERNGDYVLVWHHSNQIALLATSEDIQQKVQEVVDRRRRALAEVEAKTGWKSP